MLNWISIIAIAMAFFIGNPARNDKMENRQKINSVSNESIQSSWEMDDPLMMFLMAPLPRFESQDY